MKSAVTAFSPNQTVVVFGLYPGEDAVTANQQIETQNDVKVLNNENIITHIFKAEGEERTSDLHIFFQVRATGGSLRRLDGL